MMNFDFFSTIRREWTFTGTLKKVRDTTKQQRKLDAQQHAKLDDLGEVLSSGRGSFSCSKAKRATRRSQGQFRLHHLISRSRQAAVSRFVSSRCQTGGLRYGSQL